MLYRLTLRMKRHQLRRAIRKRKLEYSLIYMVELFDMLNDDDFLAVFEHPFYAIPATGHTLNQYFTKQDTYRGLEHPLTWLTGLTPERVRDYHGTLLYCIIRRVWHDVLSPLKKGVHPDSRDRKRIFYGLEEIERGIGIVTRRKRGSKK